MKRLMRWGDDEDGSSSDESSSDSEGENSNRSPRSKARKSEPGESVKSADAKSAKKKSGGIDFDALTRHGYRGGLSVLRVPPPKEEPNHDWSWSTGKDKVQPDKDTEESFEERQKLRTVVAEAELQAADAVARRDKKVASFSQKEKRKRDLGQASRGKNYVEEEKRLLRESGVYSGFDS